MSKFKVGDKVVSKSLIPWLSSKYRTVLGYHTCNGESLYASPVGTKLLILSEGENGRPIKTGWTDEELELYTGEFNFEEVIASIQEGEVYQNSLSSISKIDGCIEVVSINRSGRTIPKGEEYTVRFETNNYKLVPQKNNYLLFEVEHQEGGKRYLFRSDCNYNLGDIVICQTSLGKSYGKIVYKVIKELTEEEFKAYKPIIKSV